MGWLLMFVLLLLLAISAPVWPYRRGWGYYAASAISTLLAVMVLLTIFGVIPVDLPESLSVSLPSTDLVD